MPQMHPLFWLILFMFSCFMILSSMSIVFFSEEKPKQNMTPLEMPSENKTPSWKW